MKRSLLLILGVAAILTAAPAFAQYVFFDVNNDAMCDDTDVLTSGVTSLDLYYDTIHNEDGTSVTCNDGFGNTFSLLGYEIILSTSGTGTVAFGTYQNFLAGANILPGSPASGGGDYYTSFVTLSPSPEGKYKVGTLQITVSGTPVLTPATSTTLNGNFKTSFASECTAADGGNAWSLGRDFADNCGTSPLTPTRSTTWGAIKNLYR